LHHPTARLQISNKCATEFTFGKTTATVSISNDPEPAGSGWEYVNDMPEGAKIAALGNYLICHGNQAGVYPRQLFSST
jgi:hypothetical protein